MHYSLCHFIKAHLTGALHLAAQEVTEGGELETSTRRNLPFFGSVIQSIRRKGSMRNLTVNNVQVQPGGSCGVRLAGTDSVGVFKTRFFKSFQDWIL